MSPWWLVLAFLGVLAVVRWGWQPHTVVRLDGRRVELERGDLPGVVVGELRELGLRGRVMLSGAGDRLSVQVDGLDERDAQRVRNVLAQHRARL